MVVGLVVVEVVGDGGMTGVVVVVAVNVVVVAVNVVVVVVTGATVFTSTAGMFAKSPSPQLASVVLTS